MFVCVYMCIWMWYVCVYRYVSITPTHITHMRIHRQIYAHTHAQIHTHAHARAHPCVRRGAGPAGGAARSPTRRAEGLGAAIFSAAAPEPVLVLVLVLRAVSAAGQREGSGPGPARPAAPGGGSRVAGGLSSRVVPPAGAGSPALGVGCGCGCGALPGRQPGLPRPGPVLRAPPGPGCERPGLVCRLPGGTALVWAGPPRPCQRRDFRRSVSRVGKLLQLSSPPPLVPIEDGPSGRPRLSRPRRQSLPGEDYSRRAELGISSSKIRFSFFLSHPANVSSVPCRLLRKEITFHICSGLL